MRQNWQKRSRNFEVNDFVLVTEDGVSEDSNRLIGLKGVEDKPGKVPATSRN